MCHITHLVRCHFVQPCYNGIKKDVFYLTRSQYTFLKTYRGSRIPMPSSLSSDDRAVFFSCKSDRYVVQTIDTASNWFYVLSPAGLCALVHFEDELQQKAEEDARQRAAKREDDRISDERWHRDARRSWMQFAINGIFSIKVHSIFWITFKIFITIFPLCSVGVLRIPPLRGQAG